MILWSLIAVYLVGCAVLFINPSSDLDKKCLGKTLSEIAECFNDYYRDKP